MTTRPPVVITGLGMVTPLGVGAGATWSAILQGRSGAAPITRFDTTGFRVGFACEVKDWDPTRYLPRKQIKELARSSELALVAAGLAVEDAGLEVAPEEEARAGCIVGVTLGGLERIEDTTLKVRDRGPSKVSPYVIPAVCGNLAAGQISIAHRLKGPSFAPSSACATGGHSIGEAAEWIRRGRADVMLAGGTEAPITPVGMSGFSAMRALSLQNDRPTEASRPFDRERDGFVCGEGAGVVVLESAERAERRGARIYAELRGYGASSDAFHVCQPSPDGEGSARSMRMALEDAALAAEDIDYLNAHATSTPSGDLAETRGILSVFGERARAGKLAVSSTKSMTGHMLGAAGAVELAFVALAIRDGVAPPTINVFERDPDCPLDVVPNEARPMRIRHALSNAFGFGGTNASLIASEWRGTRASV